jgi:hypothetical protein
VQSQETQEPLTQHWEKEQQVLPQATPVAIQTLLLSTHAHVWHGPHAGEQGRSTHVPLMLLVSHV